MSKNITANLYSVLSAKDEEVPELTLVEGTAVDVDQPAPLLVSSEIPNNHSEAQSLSWRDNFFEKSADDIVAVFDFDYETMESHYTCLGWTCVGVSSACCPSVMPWLLVGFVPCVLNRNVRWNVRAQHIALTRTGILFVHDQHQTCWGEPYCTAAKTSRLIPYEEITSCHVDDGSATTCAMASSLTRVTVHTIKSLPGRGELEIVGLEHPLAFQKLVMTLKSGRHPSVSVSSMVGRLATVMEDRGGSAGAAGMNPDVVALLHEIRDELRVNNEVLRALQNQQRKGAAASVVVVQPSAPVEL